MWLVDIFRAKIVDISEEYLTVEVMDENIMQIKLFFSINWKWSDVQGFHIIQCSIYVFFDARKAALLCHLAILR